MNGKVPCPEPEKYNEQAQVTVCRCLGERILAWRVPVSSAVRVNCCRPSMAWVVLWDGRSLEPRLLGWLLRYRISEFFECGEESLLSPGRLLERLIAVASSFL